MFDAINISVRKSYVRHIRPLMPAGWLQKYFNAGHPGTKYLKK